MDIQDLVGKGADKLRREQPHVAGQADEVNVLLAQCLDHLGVVLLARLALGGDHARIETALLRCGDGRSVFLIGYDDRDLGVGNAAGVNRIRNGKEVRSAPGEKNAELVFFIHHEGTEHTTNYEYVTVRSPLTMRPMVYPFSPMRSSSVITFLNFFDGTTAIIPIPMLKVRIISACSMFPSFCR